MIKKINSHRSSSFQKLKDDIISNFKIKPIVQDIDLIRLKDNKIKFLIEVKQSSYIGWKPYIKKNFPYRDMSKLDDINYKALFTLAKKIPADLMVYYYVKDGLTKNGIKIFKVLNESLDMEDYGFFSLETIKKDIRGTISEKAQKRNFSLAKDSLNPNIINKKENIYNFIQNDEKIKDFYYVERSGIWTMLMSEGSNYEPLWLYIEINLKQSSIDVENLNLEDEFFPQIEIYKKTNIPFSIIAYNEDLTKFIVYTFDENNFIGKIMNKDEIIDYYSSFLKKLNTPTK